MYVRRLQLRNYGPIDNIDLAFPFSDADVPKPVVLVGENGSGKTVLLSHIVNGLLEARDAAYPESREVEEGKVYKLRSGTYIRSFCDYYFARADFDAGFYTQELRLGRDKQNYSEAPDAVRENDAEPLWEQLAPDGVDSYQSYVTSNPGNPEVISQVKAAYDKGCALYFPSDRYEDPAWLNLDNLVGHARHLEVARLIGATNRRIVSLSTLHENRDWLYDVLYDRAAYELRTVNWNMPAEGDSTVPVAIFAGFSGDATTLYESVIQVLRTLLQRDDARFGIGRRNNRLVSIQSDSGQLVPNVFQLSSGQVALLNFCLSILRDNDLSSSMSSNTEDIRGIVVVDEVDLHLHAVHQYEILPALIKLFPKVQFIITTHAPLVVLGMAKTLGSDAFELYRLPEAQRISPEEFSEFGSAYAAFTQTQMFSRDIRAAIDNVSIPTVFVEGVTDVRYVHRAAQLLGREEILQRIDIRDAGGAGRLSNTWKHLQPPLSDLLPMKILCLFDCDQNRDPVDRGRAFQRQLPLLEDSPVRRGIENLFGKAALEQARDHDVALFDVDKAHTKIVQGTEHEIPDVWTIHDDQKKANLCDWMCTNGTREDFEEFKVVFDILDEVFGNDQPDDERADATVD